MNNHIFSIDLSSIDREIISWKNLSQNMSWLLLAIFLMPINWLIESVKWQRLMNAFDNMSLRKAIGSILSGITLGLITPARIGEYVGRMLLVEKHQNSQSFYSSFLCSVSQNTIILSAGLISLLLYLKQYQIIDIETTSLIWLNSIILISCLFIYFNLHRLIEFAKKSKRLKKYLNFKANHVNSKLLTTVLLLSGIRYFVYVLQFVAVFSFLNINLPLGQLFVNIGVIYLIQSTIPVPPIIGLITRSEIAILIFSAVSINSWLIVLGTSIIWIINLILPAFLGLVIILRSNITRSFGYD